ncbi:MAG TPA: four-carbon acid sugar kinase family protein [Microvirga sp.]|jgi:uncharacterized protein YgbK (DUF1537 family)|nr:four-carbon acid sugar kinase family protein [Microvirga sp.]
MIDILILADDLSGAADCASSCLRSGRKPIVLLDRWADPGDAAVVAVDINSRAKSPQEAGAAMAAQVERLLSHHTRILYQKMDSTLRGNWAQETACVLKAMATIYGRRPLAIVAPSFPAAGRTVVGGRSLLKGVTLEATEIWARERLMRPAAPAAWLAAEGLRVAQASLDDVRRGPDRLSFVFARGNADQTDAIVCDAQTDDDLAAIARAALTLMPMPLCVGSAGLMRALAGGEGGATAEQVCDTTALRPVMVAVGSASQVSQGQVQTLVAERAMRAVMITPAALRAGRTSGPVRLVSNQISEALASGSDLIVVIDGSEGVDLREGPQLAAALADLVGPQLACIGGLIATGGETARAILTRSGVSGLRVRGEVEPGIPLSSALGLSGLSVVTKAGAFGDPTTLIRCVDAIRGRSVGF